MMQQGGNVPSPRQVRVPPSTPLHSIVGTVGPVSTGPVSTGPVSLGG